MNPLIYAHRGASGNYPENTMNAFRAAVEQGADGIEIDVQLTRDGEPVVIHDHNLDRTTTGKGSVQAHTLKEIRKLNAGRWFDPSLRQVRVPHLVEVLSLIQTTRVKLIIELKNFVVAQPGLEEITVDLINHFKVRDLVTISSFNYNSLQQVKVLNPLQKTAMLYFGNLQTPWQVAKQYHADEIHAPHAQLTPALVEDCQKHATTIVAWTVNERADLERVIRMGVDGVITDFPHLAKKIVKTK
ncbi:glycerophosphodiester phosphodiesterase [Brevibacillus dissolubilis]|uniref:glycerophosphodiester phosphodiesterase n=1 Tax=Brevibacillus dissolubilis TaxID=1844116 RepID=UPI00111645C0|nr:glycerophosphodiester phosphodiesterase [Brevibacillus dissolubilis]